MVDITNCLISETEENKFDKGDNFDVKVVDIVVADTCIVISKNIPPIIKVWNQLK